MITDSFKFQAAIWEGDIKKIQDLLASGFDLYDKNKFYRDKTMLNVATDTNNPAIVKLLINFGADVNTKNNRKQTPLLYAVIKKRHLEVIKILTNAGADVNCRYICDNSVLQIASGNNSVEVMDHLIRCGADVNAVDFDYKTPLLEAAINNNGESHMRAMRLLLNNGADVNAQDSRGKNPLHHLVRGASVEAVELLLSHNAGVNLKDNTGQTPMFEAVAAENVEVMELLLDYGAEVNEVNIGKCTPLQAACKLGAGKKILKVLLMNGAQVNGLDFKKLKCPPALKTFRIFVQYCNEGMLRTTRNKILNSYSCKDVWQIFFKHPAVLKALKVSMQPGIFEPRAKHRKINEFFRRCSEELALAGKTKLKNSWVTFFHLLVGNTRKLKNYAGNEDLVSGFKSSDYLTKFPIYGVQMLENMKKGIRKRELYDKSVDLLSDCLPNLNPTHLIITDTLDCMSIKDLVMLCN